MNRFFLELLIITVLTIGIFGCSNDSEVELQPETELNNNEDFCSYLSLEDIHHTIPLVNEFLVELPEGLTNEQIFESLVTWLNSFPCEVGANILYGIDIMTGEEIMLGVSIMVEGDGIIRELELDFTIIDNTVTYTQIDGYLYYKQDAIHVKTKYTEINSVFDFINSLDFKVKQIQNGTYLSSMEADANILQNIINNLKAKPYTTDSWVTGHLDWYDSSFVIFIRLYDMKNLNYQADWVKTMSEYELENYADGPEHIIEFYIPEGTGEKWEMNFTTYDFVDWAELSYTKYYIQ